jgi:PAS domain S-box-containing protein
VFFVYDNRPLQWAVGTRRIKADNLLHNLLNYNNDASAKEIFDQSTAVIETILEQLPIGIMIIGKNNIVKKINKSGLEIMGHESDHAIVGKLCHNSVCPAQKSKCPITDLGKTVDRSEKVVIHKNGTPIPILKTVIPIAFDGEEVLLEAFMDIAELKAKENRLKESEKRYRTIMETCADPFIVYDQIGRVTYLNPAFTETFGWRLDEVLGKRIDFVPDNTAEQETQNAIRRVLKEGTTVRFESQRLTKDGRMLDVRIAGARLQDENGDFEGIVVNLHDITRQKKALTEMEYAQKAAEDANRAKSEFLANMSHEIRTPMNGVVGMTRLLLGTDLTEEQRDYTKTIQNSGDALMFIINDILDYSKIEAGKLDLETIDFDLRVTIDDITDLVSIKAINKDIEYVAMVSPEVQSHLRGDPMRLRQIVINLLNNAIKFTKIGEVSLKVTIESEGQKYVTLRFSVKDTGIGIPKDRIDCLFESFSQVDSSTTRKYGGTGLGLSISKKLAELMDGKIGVNSREGEGSEFWFTAVLQKQPENNKRKIIVPETVTGKRVLIVDDNATNRFVLHEQLKSWGCRIEKASDGFQALDRLRDAMVDNDPFEIAILDMQMPVMDGETLGKAIVMDRRINNTLLVMMTSMGQRGDAKRLEKLGFSAYLTKPVKMSKLHDCLTTITGTGHKAMKHRQETIVTKYSLEEYKKQKVRILLAEDNLVNQKVAVKFIGKLGYNVDVVSNGKEAVAVLSKEKYDVVFMDCQMPEMDGYEATAEIRNATSPTIDPQVPIIAMTANAMKGDREKCLAAGMDDYLAKPIKSQELNDILEKWLRRNRQDLCKN